MTTSFSTFFNRQQKPIISSKKPFSLAKRASHNLILSKFDNRIVNSIFPAYLFIENVLRNKVAKTQELKITAEDSFYSNFILFSQIFIVTNSKKNTLFFEKSIDIFVYYFITQFSFKILNVPLNKRPNSLLYFISHSKVYCSDSSHKNQTINVSKYSRFDYQFKVQTRLQNSFMTSKITNLALFNKLFIDNNNDSVIEMIRNPFINSNKYLDGKALQSFTNKRINSNWYGRKNTDNIKLNFYNKRNQRRSKVFSATSIAIFPQTIWYRKARIKQVLQTKKFNKFAKTKVFTFSQKSQKVGTPFKYVRPTVLSFRLIPTEYKEAVLNSDKFSQFKAIASLRINSRFSFYQINAVSMTRFRFDSVIQKEFNLNNRLSTKKRSKHYLFSFERELNARFRHRSVYITDLVRICFFSIYFKKASFLAEFFAFTLTKQPRNRKNIPFVRFLIKLLKRFASQNNDILGVRIRIKGRLNRWLRTKHISASKGNLALSSYTSQVEYGIAQAITRKGTLGVHIWLSYKPWADNKMSKLIKSYISQ